MPYEPIVPEGHHLGNSHTVAGAVTGHVYEDGTNHLKGHAAWQFVEEPSEPWDYSDDPTADDADGATTILAGLALIGLTIGAVATVSAVKERKRRRKAEKQKSSSIEVAAPIASEQSARTNAPAGWYPTSDGRHRWWDGEAWAEHYHQGATRQSAPAGWYDDGSGRQRWWDGQDWTNHYQADPSQASVTPYQDVRSEHQRSAAAPSQDLESAIDVAVIRMTSAEWEERVRAMLLARAFSEEQWRILAHAHIEGGNGALLDWQSELRKLTPQEFSDRISAVVSARSAGQIASVIAPGWYDDGNGDTRRWDGAGWTDDVKLKEPRLAARASGAAPAGWYADGLGGQWWWDGSVWTEHRS